jgi:NADH-quinone oxidoreductase subunit L
MAEYLFLIPLLPLTGFLINGLAIGKLPKPLISFIACASVGLSFVLSVLLFFELKALPVGARVIEQSLFNWISVDTFRVDVGFLLDPLSAVMILVVTGVGFLIHVYSVGYMAHDKGYGRYFAYLNLFTFSMLMLVLANNFLLMFVGWEGVGLCSYLLIGFWYHKKSASDAGKKAFIVNRIGDFGFLIGMFIIFWTVGTLHFPSVMRAAPIAFAAGGGLITVACLSLFLGAAGKSAQIPLYVWLPDAMEGPTPVSALIHAATMVTAGVYLLARANVLFVLAPDALMVVAVIGVVTALYAGTIGLAQNDIKRVLAYSTISQLGYMFMACGVAAFSAGIFHLMTHAFFKALLFLGAGSVIHAMSGEQDMRSMGGLRKHLKTTYWTFLVATLAICGIPGFSGFFSKDEILWKSYSSPLGGQMLWMAGVAAACLTALYMFRVVYLTFWGDERMNAQTRAHIHESPKSMTVPLIALAVLSIVGGYVGIPSLFGTNYFEEWLHPVFASAEHEAATGALSVGSHGSGIEELSLMFVSVAVILLSVYAARYFYLKNTAAAATAAGRLAIVKRTLANKYYVDEFYGAVIVRPTVYFALFLWKIVDVLVIDGILNGMATLWQDVASVLRYVQSGRVRNYATIFVLGVLVLLAWATYYAM